MKTTSFLSSLKTWDLACLSESLAEPGKAITSRILQTRENKCSKLEKVAQ